jgi:hypothetical protein
LRLGGIGSKVSLAYKLPRKKSTGRGTEVHCPVAEPSPTGTRMSARIVKQTGNMFWRQNLPIFSVFYVQKEIGSRANHEE